jgi:hypothetical protein
MGHGISKALQINKQFTISPRPYQGHGRQRQRGVELIQGPARLCDAPGFVAGRRGGEGPEYEVPGPADDTSNLQVTNMH